MNRNRKAFESLVLGFMGEVTQGGGNRVIYKKLFDASNDDQIEAIVVKLEKGLPLSMWFSNFDKKEMMDYEHIRKLCTKYGLELEQQLVMVDEDTGIRSLTPYKAIVGTAEYRKQRQMWVKKFSAATDDYNIDDLTGQVMGTSRSTGISMPEITVLRNLGLYTMANELYSVKGGDQEALKAYKNDLLTTGRATVNSSLKRGTIAKSLSTVHHLMRGRHLDNNMNVR